MASPTELCLTYDGFAVGVRSSLAAPLTWLQEFLTPWFEVTRTNSLAWRIDVVIDAAEYGRLLRCEPAAPPRSIDCFTLDGRFERHPVWTESGPELTIHDQLRRTFMRIARHNRNATFIAAEDWGGSRIGLMRIVREVATASAHRRGGLHVHASAIAQPAGAILFCGPRRAGKTTLLVQALRRGGGQYLTNDRLFLHDEGKLGARGMPTIVQLRAALLESIPDLDAELLQSGFRRELTLREVGQGVQLPQSEPIRPSEDGPPVPGLSPRQFCTLLNVAAVGAERIAAIVFPEIDANATQTTWRDLPQEEASQRLFAHALLRTTTGDFAEAFEPPDCREEADDGQRREMCNRVVSRVPSLACVLGRDVLESPDWLPRLFESIAHSQPAT